MPAQPAASVRVSVSDAGNSYLDLTTIRKAGDKSTVWEMTDYKILPDKSIAYKSVKRQFEFDCKAETWAKAKTL